MHALKTHTSPPAYRRLTHPTHCWGFQTGLWLRLALQEKKKSGERYSCNFLLVISLSLDDGSWQNWDRGARAKRPNTSESSLCCTVSLFSDSVPRLFKIHARNGVWFGFQDPAGLKGLKEKRERRGGRREMLTACDGCSSSTVLNKVGTFISQVSCECQSVCFLYFSFVSLITACYLNASQCSLTLLSTEISVQRVSMLTSLC